MKRIILILATLFAVSNTELQAQESFENPILAGFYPDPSICRVGEDYFMVNSSFEWFPGIPIHHSRDLVNWEPIGHVLSRPSQLTIKQGMKASAGVWAPTIRYINNKYYVIVTAKQCGNTFYVSADDPYGEWSEPVYLRDAPGIDPSLFYDDDGKVWICANDKYKPEEMVKGQTSNEFIWLQQIDLERGKLKGKRYRLPHGLTLNSPATEAPHIYKVNGKYYLMTAEGMTWNNHAVALFKADKITGPYVACNNGKPVLTHRELPMAGGDITTTGHADIVETQNGEWWAVLLAVRPVEEMNLLGRESFLCPIKWEGEELVFAPESGRVDMEMKRPNLEPHPFEKIPSRDEFDAAELRYEWNFLRTPLDKFYALENGALELELRPEVVDSLVTPSFIARRVQSHKFSAVASVEFAPKAANEEAGLVIMQNSTNFYKFTISQDEAGAKRMKLVKSDRRNRGIYETTVSDVIDFDGAIVMGIEGDGLEYRFYYNLAGEGTKGRIYFGGVHDASVCASNRAGGFTGSYVGPYTSSNGVESSNKAVYEWFDYKNLK